MTEMGGQRRKRKQNLRMKSNHSCLSLPLHSSNTVGEERAGKLREESSIKILPTLNDDV